MRNVAAQRHRINRVMNFVRSNVADALDLGTLADVACLSKFHFSRVFDAHFDETPSQFLTRVRLELAARKLVYIRDPSIIQIAMDCGFSGPDTFSRAFRNRFGIAPKAFRASNEWCFERFEQTHPYGHEIYKPAERPPQTGHDQLRVRIEQRPGYRVGYIRHAGPYGDVNDSISGTFTVLQRWARRQGLLNSKTSYIGLCADNCIVTPARHCMYDAGILVPDEVEEDDTISIQTVPPGTYAVLHVVCNPSQLYGMGAWMLSTWLPGSGRKLSFRPKYEFFPEFGDRPVKANYGAEICLPVEGPA